MENGLCSIDTRDVFKREIGRQFYHEDVAYQAQRRMKRLTHMGSIREYVKEFSNLMLEIPNADKEDLPLQLHEQHTRMGQAGTKTKKGVRHSNCNGSRRVFGDYRRSWFSMIRA